MKKGSTKLLDLWTLRQMVEAGLTEPEMAARLDCHRDTVRRALQSAGMAQAPSPAPAQRPAFKDRPAARVEVLTDRTIFFREVTAGINGGMMRTRLSLARISMHVAALQEAGRC